MKKYEQRFRELFNLSKDDPTSFRRHGIWVELRKNPLGTISLQWGIKYEGVMAQVVWHRGRPVFADGSQNNLAVVIHFAEQIGLDTNHPYLQNCKQTTDYEKISTCWQNFAE